MRHVLYATDGSEGALAAGRFLGGLPHARGVHVHVLTVLGGEAPGDGGASVLSAAAAALGAFPGHVTTATARAGSAGEVTEVLLQTARCLGADLIAVGSRGLSPLARLFLGSVAEAVVRRAECPALVARQPAGPLREVVAGIDGSPESEEALCWAARELPFPPGTRLRLVRVVAPAPAPHCAADELPLGSDIRADALAARAEIAAARRDGDALAASLGDGEGGSRASFEMWDYDDPAAALIEAARRYDAGLLVVGTRGTRGLTRALLGSVSERVLRHAPCSVLVVHRPPAP